MPIARVLLALPVAVALASCAATQTTIAKRNLDVQTKMSQSVFLEPVSPARRTVYVEVRNTSDRPELDLATPIRQQIAANGYRVVDDPALAQYMLQANVLQAGREAPTAGEASGGASTIGAGAIGAGIGYGIGNQSASSSVAGGLIGATAGYLADTLVKDVTYTIIADVQVSERVPFGTAVTQTTDQSLTQGTSGSTQVLASEVTDWKRYQTRVVSTANKANLEWQEAAPDLVAGLSRSVGGIF